MLGHCFRQIPSQYASCIHQHHQHHHVGHTPTYLSPPPPQSSIHYSPPPRPDALLHVSPPPPIFISDVSTYTFVQRKFYAKKKIFDVPTNLLTYAESCRSAWHECSISPRNGEQPSPTIGPKMAISSVRRRAAVSEYPTVFVSASLSFDAFKLTVDECGCNLGLIYAPVDM